MYIDQEPDEDLTLPRFASVLALLEENVAERAFPGCVFGVAHRGHTVALAGVGRFTFKPDSNPVLPGTSFDLASVSKVVATTAMAMLLWQRGFLDLDTPLHEILPAFLGKAPHADDVRRRQVTLRMLLTHSNGLPAYEPLYESFPEPVGLFRAMLGLPLAADPGTVSAYSDPGFILLGAALEVLAGEAHGYLLRA